MQHKQIDTQEAQQGQKYIAHLDAKRKSAQAQKLYSNTQQQEANTVYNAVRTSYARSKVYLTYRNNFYTIKVHHPAAADKLSKNVAEVEVILQHIGAEKIVSAQGIIYRVNKR